jgi:hypothetical protein
MANKSLDLTKLLPKQYRDKTTDSLLKNLFERHVSKSDTVPLYGTVGDGQLDPGEIKLNEKTLERQINQITSLIYAEHATEKKVFSWPDLVQKLVLLGVDYKSIGDWFQTASYNFVPPIDLDKFCNFNEYFWIGPWIKKAPNLPYHLLGLPSISYVTDAFSRTNSTYYPEYYTIRRSGVNQIDYSPRRPIPNLKTNWSDWGYTNLWVHKQDLIDFVSVYGTTVSFNEVTPATRPIIEYKDTLRLNTAQNAQGEPIESVNNNKTIQKNRANQPPLFDIYDQDGVHYGMSSAIFYYVEGSEYPIDTVIQRRVARNSKNDLIFEHSLIDGDTSKLIFYKDWDGNQFNLKTIWSPGPVASPRYVKYDTSGTIINKDKFTNFSNYYWKALPGDVAGYNPTAEPEYVVIETGNDLSDWSIFNKWAHVSELKLSEIHVYIQAHRPIIEFNKYLETELTIAKWHTGQLPKFNMYLYDTSVPDYRLIGHQSDQALTNLNDAYLKGSVFVRLNDLDDELHQAILSTPELVAKTITFNDELYLQSLDSGMFIPTKDGNVYGYRTDVVSDLISGKGTVGPITLDSNCVPEILTLTYDIGTNLFNVTGSVSSQNHDLIPDSTYSTLTGLTFVITTGVIPFDHGDQITINVKSFIFEQKSLYVKLGDEYRTLNSAAEILDENLNVLKIDANHIRGDGIWEVPPQIEWNVHNETRAQVNQGDLYFHLTSIIAAQPGLIGSETGNNNYRQLPVTNPGLGGLIKQYDGLTSLLVSLLIQEGLSVPTLIEFARQSYDNLFNEIHRFIEDKIPMMLTNVEFVPPVDGDNTIDVNVVNAFKQYFLGSTQSLLTDTTSPIKGLVPTLPYLGLCGTKSPGKILDLELNIPMMVHHDGHQSALTPIDISLMKTIVTKKFTRTLGEETPGAVSATEFPKNPFKGQFWFQTSTGKLFFYNVVSEVGELPTVAEIGAYSIDRAAGLIWQYNGEWVQLGIYEVNEPWMEVRLDLIEQNLILALENELYDNCPPVNPRLDQTSLMADPNYLANIKNEFEKFGIIYGTPDVYSSAYNAANPFTWNYVGITGSDEVWSEIYRHTYGTPRPDLQPWIPGKYASEADMLNDLSSLGFIAGSMAEWDPSLWTVAAISDYIRQRYIDVGTVGLLSVDISNGALLAPYSVYADGLFKQVPSTASNTFSFGGLGPVEMFWKKTINYLYSLQKTYFKINPLNYIEQTWGIRYTTVGNYNLNTSLGRKDSPKDFQLHGDSSTTNGVQTQQQINSLLSATIIEYPQELRTYKIQCINRVDNLFTVYLDGSVAGFLTPGSVFNDDSIALYISPTLTSFYWGDSYTVIVDVDGIPSISNDQLPTLHIEGLNQIYVQYRRLYGEDVNLSINQTLLHDWTIRAGYRFGSLVNTDTLTINSQNELIDQSNYQILIKENKFFNSSWLNSLKIQLVQKGSSLKGVPRAGNVGSIGDDWIFRVDNFNDSRTELQWYDLDTTGASTDFIAMGGKASLSPWKRYLNKKSVVTHYAPFLIRGIQNVVNFLFGYSDKLEADGWRFNDQDNPVLDETTGRPVGFQLLIEQFISQQFQGVDAGSAFVVNPFSRKVWYNTPHGFIADMYAPLGIERELVCSILDQTQRPIPKSEIRVFRQDDVSELIFDIPVYTLHVLTSEYEHVALFNDYTVANILINDTFLGQRANKIFFDGEKQSTFTGRLDLGGHYVFGDQMKRNIENSVSSILKMYDTSGNNSQNIDTERARSLLGFSKKSYFADRGTTDETEFRFWQGMIANKGTNFAVDAFVNSSKYQSTKLDEYWAYRLADYGDARAITKAELRVQPDDCSEITKYLLLENDELNYIKAYKKNAGFDSANLGIDAYDVATLYTAIQSAGFEYVDPIGCNVIRPDDESRWFSYNDLKLIEYFEAAPATEYMMVADSLDRAYIIYDKNGDRVRADCFEIVDMLDPERLKYYEMGSITDSDPFDFDTFDENSYDLLNKIVTNQPDYDPPLFKRLNHHTIQITDPILLNKPLKVIAYGPSFSRYSPSSLIDYRDNVSVVDDIIWWDPARGVHHPRAYNEVDYVQEINPAKYNRSLVTFKNSAMELIRPWGEDQVGKIWWNTKDLSYQPYSDAKIITDMNDRVASWGAISDASTIEVYEWVKSAIPPDQYDIDPNSDGIAAFRDTITRSRTWFQRPVAWKFSPNPIRSPRVFSAYQPSRMLVQAISGVNGRAILNTGDFISILNVGCKFAGAIYSSQSKTDAQLTGVFGTAKLTSDPYVVVGSSDGYTTGATFSTNPYFSISADLDQRILNFRKKNYLGRYVLSGEQDKNDFYVRLTHVDSGETQRIRAHDLPVLVNTQDSYNFDNFGIIIVCTSLISRDDLIGTTDITRQQHAILSLGLDHDLYLRSAVDVEIMIPFSPDQPSEFFLDGSTDVSHFGWIGWEDPSTNPNTGLVPPLNRYSPFVGDWTPIEGHLTDVADDIRTRLADPWTWFDGLDFNSYKGVWTPWVKVTHKIIKNDYYIWSRTSHLLGCLSLI